MSVSSIEQRPPRKILRSILALLAGLFTVIVLSTVADMALESTIFPEMATPQVTDFMLAIALGYRCVIAGLGGYVTARLAPHYPLMHVFILGAIGTALAALGVILMWSIGHHWYAIALVVTTIPCAYLGGKFEA